MWVWAASLANIRTSPRDAAHGKHGVDPLRGGRDENERWQHRPRAACRGVHCPAGAGIRARGQRPLARAHRHRAAGHGAVSLLPGFRTLWTQHLSDEDRARAVACRAAHSGRGLETPWMDSQGMPACIPVAIAPGGRGERRWIWPPRTAMTSPSVKACHGSLLSGTLARMTTCWSLPAMDTPLVSRAGSFSRQRRASFISDRLTVVARLLDMPSSSHMRKGLCCSVGRMRAVVFRTRRLDNVHHHSFIITQAPDQAARRSTPRSVVPGATVLNTVPYFFTFSCSRSRRWSLSSVSTRMS